MNGLPWLDTTTNPVILKIYDGADWIPLFAINTSNNTAFPLTQSPRMNFPLAGGSGNAQTITLTPAISAYTDGDVFTFEAVATNSGATTLNINGVGALAVRKMNSSGADVALAANDILDGGRYTVNFDSAANSSAGAFILVQPSLDLASLSGTIQNSQLPTRLQEAGTQFSGSFNNAAFTSGWYRTTSANQSWAPNTTDNFNVHILWWNSLYQIQDAYATGSPTLHYRRWMDNGTWSAWQRCYDTSAEVQSLVDNALVSLGYGGVATYAWLYQGSISYTENSNVAGSSVVPAGFTSSETAISSDSTNGETRGTRGGGAEAGSWNRRGRQNSGARATLNLHFRYA